MHEMWTVAINDLRHLSLCHMALYGFAIQTADKLGSFLG